MDLSELIRYIEYLQRSLAGSGFPDLTNQEAHQKWVKNNEEKLKKILNSYPGGIVDKEYLNYIELVLNFKPDTEFETFSASKIFNDILVGISATVDGTELKLATPVKMVCSPEVGIGPCSRYSSDNHLIFAGLGTSHFCNYWAKVYAWLFTQLGENQLSSDEIKAAMPSLKEIIFLACKLCVYYGHTNTFLCFGVVDTPENTFRQRVEILAAMEVFTIAHEYAHLLLEEKDPSLQGSLNEKAVSELEFRCDAVAFAICRKYGEINNNWMAFSGAGAYLFFEAVENSNYAREKLKNGKFVSDGHPSPIERQKRILDIAINSTHKDEKTRVASYLGGLSKIVKIFSETCTDIINSVEFNEGNSTS